MTRRTFLGAAAFSIYNTSAPEQIAHVLANAGNEVVFTETTFVDRLRDSGGAVRHIVCVDGHPDGTRSLF